MLRCRSIASLQRTLSTPPLVDFSRASPLDLFEQPARAFFSTLLGFRVDDVESFKKDWKQLVKRNLALAPKPGGTEGDIRLKLLAKCKHGQFQLADPDGVIDMAAAW